MLRLKDKIEASVTYADHAGTADSAKVATKLGSAGVGNMANFIYLNAGIPTASNSTIGGSTVPIYMKSGVMTQCIYSLKDACSKSVRTKSSIGDSGWKDNATDDGYVPTMSFMAYWNGAYSGSSSNLTYCKYGAFGSIVTKNSGDYAPASHSHAWSTITRKPALMEAGDYSAETIHALLVKVQGISPRMGSTCITKETCIPNCWYNFIYIPHRDGIGGDNPDYGTLLLFSMVDNGPSYIIRAGKSGSVARLCKIYTDGEKPSKSDVGLGNVDNTADSAKSVKYATTAGSANSVAWGNVSGKPSTFTPASHTHKKSQITDFPTSLKNPTALTIQTNGTTAATYDGSAAKTVNITKSSIGLGSVNNTADSAKSVKYAASAGAVGGYSITASTSDLTPGSSNLTSGKLYFVYE